MEKSFCALSSRLRPLHFNVIINGIFQLFQNSELSNHADDTMHSSDENITNIMTSLNQIINNIFKFRKNTYNLRNVHLIESQNTRTKGYRLDCITFRASQI